MITNTYLRNYLLATADPQLVRTIYPIIHSNYELILSAVISWFVVSDVSGYSVINE